MAAFMWSVLLLAAASVSGSPVGEKLSRPDWWPENIEHPEWIPWPPQHPEGIPWPPQRPDWLPEDIQHPEWIPWPPAKPEWSPEDIQHPEWIPWPPAKPEWSPEDIQHPEWIPWPPQHPENIPWPPTKPEWWPEIDWENIQKPEINEGVPGTRTSIEEYPGIVQIEIGTGEYWTQGCVGNVLTSLHILSVASCFSGRFNTERYRRIRAGSGIRSVGGIVIPVDSVLNHHSHGESNENIFDGNLAIAKLSYFLTFSPTIGQTSIVSQGFTLPNELPLILASWGATAQGERKTNDNLYKIDLVSLNSETCNNKWNELSRGLIKVTSNMICAARPETGGRNLGIRDIGAPIFYSNTLVGIVSWGNPLGNQKFPVAATSISSYTNWIVENAA